MERLREEARAVPPPRDVVGDEFLGSKPTLAKVKVLVVCKDFGFWEEAPGRSHVHVWSSRLSCEAPAAQTPKFNEKTPQRGKKRTNFVSGEKKKERNFGRSRGRAVPERVVL